MSFVVTIDGPAAAGKSTTARGVAERLGLRVLDTGAFYRAIALKAMRSGVAFSDRDTATALVRASEIRFTGPPAATRVFLDGVDVTEAIRTQEVSDGASRVAAMPEVRRLLVEWQRRMAEAGPVVGEGRDLGTVVFPDAAVKIFLDADLETRAGRRFRELQLRGLQANVEDVRRELARRDERDRTREDSPLRPAEGAIVVDTSGLDMDGQVEAVLEVVRAHPACPGGASEQA